MIKTIKIGKKPRILRVKEGQLMKRLIAVLMVLCLAVGMLAGCGSEGAGRGDAESVAPTPTPEPTPVPLNPNPLTGLEKAADFHDGKAPVAVMVNNIKMSNGNDAFPQWGIGAADVIYEMVTEGGITRMMAVYSDYTKMPKVGPVRSARDQHVQLMLPMGALYVHEGASIFAARMLRTRAYPSGQLAADRDEDGTFDWGERDLYLGNPLGFSKGIVKWDQDRRNYRSQEMCAYTSGEQVMTAVENGADDSGEPDPLFNFVRYDEPARVPDGVAANDMHFQYSSSYYSDFTYDAATSRYLKGNTKGEPHIDGDTNEQLAFDNVLLLFTQVVPYSQLGYDAGMLVHVEYSWGGVGYYFTQGKMEPIRWMKGLPREPLRIVDAEGHEIDVEINCGKTYVGVTDNGMFDYCKLNGNSMNAEITGDAPELEENAADNVEAEDA